MQAVVLVQQGQVMVQMVIFTLMDQILILTKLEYVSQMMVVKKNDKQEEDEKSVKKQEKIKEVRRDALRKERLVKDVEKEDKNKM